MTAAIVAVEAEEPRILVATDPKGGIRAGLPFGPFDPLAHRTFEIGLRNWVAAQTAINVGYVEQLTPSATAVVTPRRSAKPQPASSRGTGSFPGLARRPAGDSRSDNRAPAGAVEQNR